MGIFDDIQKAFNPNDNGLNKSIQHTNEVLSQTFDPNKNKVADTFKESFTDFGNRVDLLPYLLHFLHLLHLYQKVAP